MRITFDAVPICSDKMTGIGWCELGQTQTIAELYPENSYEYSFFTSGDNERVKRVKKFAGKHIKLNTSGFSGFTYRAVSTFLPVPYSFFFGRKSDNRCTLIVTLNLKSESSHHLLLGYNNGLSCIGNGSVEIKYYKFNAHFFKTSFMLPTL